METHLKKQMPHLIYSNHLEFANNNGHDGIWEIKANRFQLKGPDPLTVRWRELLLK